MGIFKNTTKQCLLSQIYFQFFPVNSCGCLFLFLLMLFKLYKISQYRRAKVLCVFSFPCNRMGLPHVLELLLCFPQSPLSQKGLTQFLVCSAMVLHSGKKSHLVQKSCVQFKICKIGRMMYKTISGRFFSFYKSHFSEHSPLNSPMFQSLINRNLQNNPEKQRFLTQNCQ